MTRALLLAACLVQASPAASEVMSIVDKAGHVLSASLISCDGTNITVSREPDKKTFTIPLDRLDDASQKSVKTWMDQGGNISESFDVTVETGKNRRTTSHEDYDDKRVNLDPIVTIRNPNTRLSTCEAKLTVLFLGRPVSDNSALHVFKKSTFDLPKMAPLASQDFSIGIISAAYDSRGYAQFGARYIGYVVLIHDGKGEKLYDSESVPSAIVSNFGLKLIGLKENMAYNRDLRPVRR